MINTNFGQIARNYVAGYKSVLDEIPVGSIERFAEDVLRAFEQGRQVFIVGNGGSASTASHMACDFGKTAAGSPPRPGVRRMRVISLSDNVSLMTAWANDVSYDRIFSEQLVNLASPGDLLIVITGSGTSRNIVEAVRQARDLEVRAIGLLGFDGGVVKDYLDDYILVPSDNYGYIEDAHLMLNHLITACLKQRDKFAGETFERHIPRAAGAR